ncbi:LysM peptidoglycan-binding domain-containing protein [Pelomonas sp. SE-A7]|uniref:LysM peptidoglycan-binding domain-containing protein n=1 Tax=Pelomonas sp. SE-A7 TaxID=3054953 RepID=UPI00259C69A9|nr:LysM peptidoglycan-binding domain-containing protein [Pelomonas sp. SE-A7]MDM4766744.1 LysM peptidoglycan-binding domain-containing protein [Pelomonas sp. SE-A7]
MPSCVNPLKLSLLAASLVLVTLPAAAQGQYPITDAQRQTADKVAQAGVPLSELAPDAPESHTVKTGDTLWDISKIFLKSPWRWPELWGMNREQIANPHLIYPGQVLYLVKKDGRATLQMAQPVGNAGMQGLPSAKLSPQVRGSRLEDAAIQPIPQHLIEPFLNEAVVFDTDAINTAPRIVAAPEGRVMATRGDLAYARGATLKEARDWRVFRQAKPLRDPTSGEVLGFEAAYVGSAELTRLADEVKTPDGKTEPTASTLTIRAVRQEIGVGDRLSPVPQREFVRYVPHAPASAMKGQIIAIYGDALTGGQNQIVSLNRGRRDGMERGHVLGLLQDGRRITDATGERREEVKLPDERIGTLFVFQVYERVSYALIVSAQQPVRGGDRFSQP